MSFAELGRLERARPQPLELDLAMLLKRLAEHLRRQPRLHVFQPLDRVVAVLELRLVLLLQRGLEELLLGLLRLQVAGEVVPGFLDRGDRVLDRHLLRQCRTLGLCLEPRDLGVLRSGGLLDGMGPLGLGGLHLRGQLRDLGILRRGRRRGLGCLCRRRLLELGSDRHLRQLDRGGLLLRRGLEPVMQLLLELAVADLLDDVGVPGLVDRKGLAAVRADDLVHRASFRMVGQAMPSHRHPRR